MGRRLVRDGASTAPRIGADPRTPTGMTHINPAAAAAREHARTATGQFGHQQHAQPDTDLDGNAPSSETRQATMLNVTLQEWVNDYAEDLDTIHVDPREVLDTLPVEELERYRSGDAHLWEFDDDWADILRREGRQGPFVVRIDDEDAFDEYIRQRETGERRGRIPARLQYGVPEGRELFEHTDVSPDSVQVSGSDIDSVFEAVENATDDVDRRQAQAELRAWADLAGQLGYDCQLPADGDLTQAQLDAARSQLYGALDELDEHPLLGVDNRDGIEAWGRQEAREDIDEDALEQLDSYVDWHRYGINRLEARTDTVTLGGNDYYAFTDE